MKRSSSAVRVGNHVLALFPLIGISPVAANLRAPISSFVPVPDQVQPHFSLSGIAAGLANAFLFLLP
jgi:cyanate permease